jgi:hypothetical protein
VIKDRLAVEFKVRSALVHFYGENGLVYSVKNRVYLLPDLARPRPIPLGLIPWGMRDVLCHIRLIDRALKGSILQVSSSPDGRLLISTGHSWWTARPGGTAERIEPFSGTRPMNRGICRSKSGVTYIADYQDNPERKCPVRIYATSDFDDFATAWEFPPGAIRHIHALVPDSETPGRIWVLTGDEDRECHFLYTDDDFISVKAYLSKGQMTRTADLIFRNGKLIWGMDSPLETSYLLSSGRDNPEVTRLLELPGPVYYMAQNQAGGIYCGTTVEAGPAVKDRFGRVYGSSPDETWDELVRCRDDFFPQRGIFYFPCGILPDNYLVFSQRALIPNEGVMTIARDKAWPDHS